MAREEHVELPDDFEAFLRKEMAAVPSPAFLPRVRERIAMEPSGRRPWSWPLAVASALATVVVVVSLGTFVDTDVPPPVPARVVMQTGAGIGPISLPERATPARAATVQHPARPSTPAASAPPVVIVDERQREALGSLIRLIHQGRLTGEAFAQTVPTSLQPIRETVLPVGVAPVQVSPIADGGVLQNGTEK